MILFSGRGIAVRASDYLNRSIRTAACLAILVVAVPGVMLPLAAGGSIGKRITVGRTGGRLPVWIRSAVCELLKDLSSFPACPIGSTLTARDIILINRFVDLKPIITQAQYEFVAGRRAPSFVLEHRFPIFVVGESPDLQFIESLSRNEMADQAILLAKALLAHEAMHVWFNARQGLSDKEVEKLTAEEFERKHEVAAYELQLAILKKDLVAGKYARMFTRIAKGNIDLTSAIEERLMALKSGLPVR